MASEYSFGHRSRCRKGLFVSSVAVSVAVVIPFIVVVCYVEGVCGSGYSLHCGGMLR